MIKENQSKPAPTQTAPKTRMKRIFEDYLNGISISVVCILIAFIFMAYMTNITAQTEIDLKDVGIQTALLYLSTVSINFILRSYGMRKGRRTEAWDKASEAVEKNNGDILLKGFTPRASTYCREWENAELDERRNTILQSVGITLDDYTKLYSKYTAKELREHYSITEIQIKAIVKARRQKRLRYNEAYLTARANVEGRRTSPSGGLKVRTITRIQAAKTILSAALSSVFAVGLLADLIIDPSFATLVMCFFKVAVTLIFGFLGLHSGFVLTSEKEVAEMNDKADAQTAFMQWCEKGEEKEKQPTECELQDRK